MTGTNEKPLFVLGVVSDTHGPVPAAALAALGGADRIVHAGDYVDPEALVALGRVAPVTAVRGNMDRFDPRRRLPFTQSAEWAGRLFYVIHDLGGLDLDPAAAEIDCVIHGHTHRASVEWKDGVLYVNPGSAARPRGGLPASVARLAVFSDRLVPGITPL